MQKIIVTLEEQGVKFSDLGALELFGGRGSQHLKAYAEKVGSLEIWEIDPSCESELKKKYPKARVVIGDSYEILKKNVNKFDLVVVDNPVTPLTGHFEHLELFPEIFNLLNDTSLLIINIIPQFTYIWKENTLSSLIDPEDVFSEDHLRAREAFYESKPGNEIPIEKMIEVYQRKLASAGFALENYLLQKRGKSIAYYLVMRIKKIRRVQAP